MKLLFDQNLSHHHVKLLDDVYPNSLHVIDVGLHTATDTEIWNFAKDENYVIISKDSDFHQRSFLLGPPPKVIWVNKGNCSTYVILKLLRIQADNIESFAQSKNAFLVIE